MKEMLAKFSSISLGMIAGHVPVCGAGDPLGMASLLTRMFADVPLLRQGIVVTYDPQTHTATVQVGQKMWTCVFSDERLSYSFGFSETRPPREGELVLVHELAKDSTSGVIVGRIPYPLNFSIKGDMYNDPDQYHRRLYTQLLEPTKDRSINCYLKPFTDKDNDSTHIATHFRPTDVYPGEFVDVNQHNAGFKGGMFSATMLGGGASLRLSGLTNSARMTCDSYRRHSLLGNMHEFHNGRYLSSERDVALYQEERLGGIRKQHKVWTEDSERPVKGEDQTIRPRMKDLSGFYGHLSAKFCMRPDPEESDVRTLGPRKEAGVSRETIDPSGQYRLSASGMLILERTGRIPVPVRTCYPTDKDHDIKQDPETLEEFKHDESDPCYRQLELFDRQAYDLKTQYARVDGLGFEKTDYYAPQEEELPPLKDIYDENFTQSKTVKLRKFDKRRAGMYIGEDGSVIVRDAWGSEIVMVGGNVTIACAGNVMMLPGKTQLTVAGDDIVQKAQNSIDIHASAHDVRLSATRNMEMVGGKGVIVESKGDNSGPWDGQDKGESASLSGIFLKAKGQAISTDCDSLVLRSRKRTRLLSGSESAGSESMDGDIGIGAKSVRLRAITTNISSGKSSLCVSRKDILMGSEAGIIMRAKSIIPIRGTKYPVPLLWIDVGEIDVNTPVARATEDLKDEKEASVGFGVEALEKMKFGFRTSSECATDRPWAIGGGGNVFRAYEPAWVQVKDIYETLKGVGTKNYTEEGTWDNGKPFPGKEVEPAEYAQLLGMKPKNLTSDGLNKRRDSVQDNSPIEIKKFVGDYVIRS